jgi:phage baseplate assembly protein W
MLGRGWAFPVQRDHSAGRTLAMNEGDSCVRDAIVIILSTRKGERVMRPEFGCDLDRLMFAPNDGSARATAEFEVKEALQDWEPRIDVLGVSARAGGERGEVMLVDISYRVISTDNRYNLVFPFYLDRALT